MTDTKTVATWPKRFMSADLTFLSWSEVDQERITQLLGRVGMIKNLTSLRVAALNFYPGTKLLAASRRGTMQDLFFLLPPGEEREVTQLNSSNERIYAFNEEHGITLTKASQLDYIRFFFHFVRGSLGSFQIVEQVSDINWRPDATEEIKSLTAGLLLPVSHRGQHSNGLFRNTATMIFKNALFKTDVYLAPRLVEVAELPGDEFPESYSLGQAALKNEELLMEDLPVNGY